MLIIRQSECDYNAVFIPFRREECWKEQHKYDMMICPGIKWNYIILLFTVHSLHKDEHISRTFYVSSRLCCFIVFLPCDIFSSPLLCPSTIFPICSHSSCVSIEGVRGGEGRGERDPRTEELHSGPPFHLSTSGFQLQRDTLKANSETSPLPVRTKAERRQLKCETLPSFLFMLSSPFHQ